MDPKIEEAKKTRFQKYQLNSFHTKVKKKLELSKHIKSEVRLKLEKDLAEIEGYLRDLQDDEEKALSIKSVDTYFSLCTSGSPSPKQSHKNKSTSSKKSQQKTKKKTN